MTEITSKTNTTGTGVNPRSAKRTRTHTHFVRTENGQRVLVPGDPTRTDQVVSWLGWHLGELAGVLVPAGLAVTVSPWFGLLAAGIAVGWTVHEVRTAHEQDDVKTGRDLPAAVGTPLDAPTDASEGGEA